MIINVISGLLMAFGLFFFSVGTIGLFRFPDVLSRIHSGAKCDTLGGILCIASLIGFIGLNGTTLKLVLVIVFLWIGNPTGTNVMANGILKSLGKEK